MKRINETLLDILKLERKQVTELWSEKIDDSLIIHVTQSQNHIKCSHCGSLNIVKNGHNRKTIKCKLLNDDKTIIKLFYQAFICNDCGKFTSDDPLFAGKKKHVTDADKSQIIKDLIQYKSTFNSVGLKYNLSKTEIEKIFDEKVNYERLKLPQIISIDECFAKRMFGSKNFFFIIYDFMASNCVDITLNRKSEHLREYFEQIDEKERLNVLYVTMDMSDPYRTLMHKYFPNAELCADPFHVIRDLIEYVRKIKSRVLAKTNNIYLHNLLKDFFDDLVSGKQEKYSKLYKERTYKQTLTYQQLEDAIFSINEEITQAIKFVQDYIELDKIATYDSFEHLFKQLINRYPIFFEKCFRHIRTMFNNWFTEIKNSHVWVNGQRLTNAKAESNNNVLGEMIDAARGFNNFKRTRNKFMHYINNKDSIKR